MLLQDDLEPVMMQQGRGDRVGKASATVAGKKSVVKSGKRSTSTVTFGGRRIAFAGGKNSRIKTSTPMKRASADQMKANKDKTGEWKGKGAKPKKVKITKKNAGEAAAAVRASNDMW